MKALRALTQSLSLSVAAAIGLALASSAAVADDLAAWSERIDDDQDRFEVVGLLTAYLDRETQLVWLREPKRTVATWDEARNYCLNVKASYGSRLRMGWRLPSVHELSTLATLEWAQKDRPPFGRLVDEIQFRERPGLWTATSVAEDVYSAPSAMADALAGTTSDAFYAYAVDLTYVVPEIQVQPKDNKLGVVCVRGPFNSSQY
jgi:hypothetical protein